MRPGSGCAEPGECPFDQHLVRSSPGDGGRVGRCRIRRRHGGTPHRARLADGWCRLAKGPYAVLGLVVLVVMVPVGGGLFRDRPELYGLLPDRGRPVDLAGAGEEVHSSWLRRGEPSRSGSTSPGASSPPPSAPDWCFTISRSWAEQSRPHHGGCDVRRIRCRRGHRNPRDRLSHRPDPSEIPPRLNPRSLGWRCWPQPRSRPRRNSRLRSRARGMQGMNQATSRRSTVTTSADCISGRSRAW